MTKFEPAVAYRILREKQERLNKEAADLTYNAIYGRVTGKIGYSEESLMLERANVIRDEAARLYRPLAYLRERMEEE